MNEQENDYNIQDMLAEEIENRPSPEIKIINAAIKNFSEKGYHATKTKDIAVSAGIAEGTIFRYFKTKEDILLKLYPLALRIVVPRLIDDLAMKVEKQGKITAEELAIYILVDRYKMFQTNQKLFLAIMPEVLYRKELMKILKEQVFTHITETLERFATSSLDENYQIDKVAYCKFIINTLFGMVISRFLLPDTYQLNNVEQEIAEYVQTISMDWRVQK